MKIVEIETKPKLVSIIIPNYFTGKPGRVIDYMGEAMWFAERCFKRIKKYTTLPYELILIDDGSLMGHELLDEWADVLIRTKKNQGFAKSCNQGFNLAKGEWIVLCNNDILVYAGWLEALIKTFEDNEDCGIAMPALMKQTKDGREADKLEEIDLTLNYDKYGVGAEFGSCYLIKKETVEAIKKMNNDCFFDKRFLKGFGEDRNLYRQVRMLELQTYRTHKTRTFHQGGTTMCGIKDRRKYTHPNREYLKRLTELEKDGKRLSEQEKDKLKAKVIADFKSGKILIRGQNLWKND